jgi:alcohol dehydrogenase class IV
VTAAGRPAADGPLGPFTLSRLPRVEFGRGRIERLPAIVAGFGRRALVVTGARSFRATDLWPALVAGLDGAGVRADAAVVTGEPSPGLVDATVAQWREAGIDVVVGIGGGSVLDAAKAVAGLLRSGTSVIDHLEVVGRGLPYEGPSVPLVAVPTTAGTGSEATKNAVLGERGAGGFKRSFRDDRLVAQVAVVDPDLLDPCPRELIAADGMDAVTQLLEAYVSTGAGPFTDALALAGLEAARDGLLRWFELGPGAGEASAAWRERMAFAALVSGICLAQAGLGAVHGLAAPLGAALPVPHGVACGTVLAPATGANVRALRERRPESPALARYARAGRALLGDPDLDDDAAIPGLERLLAAWSVRLRLGGLGAHGLTEAAIPAIVAEARGGSMRTNPIALTDEELAGVLRAAL